MMKNIFLVVFAILISLNLSAQTRTADKQDIITKTSGEEMKGRIIRISDANLYFTYPGETLEYTIKKTDVSKIVHASGRVETFTNTLVPGSPVRNDQVSMTATPADHHNKIAILPFTYLLDNQPASEEVGMKAQQDAYSFLVRHAAGYTILEPRTANALLLKAGATKETIASYTMNELCGILGVEYIIEGIINQTRGAQSSYASSNSNTTVKRDNRDNRRYSDYNSSVSNSVQHYDIRVSLQIYMDNNANIFNKEHKMLLSNVDGSYNAPLEFLLKRCPLYKK